MPRPRTARPVRTSIASIACLSIFLAAPTFSDAPEPAAPTRIATVNGILFFEHATLATLVKEINRHHGCRLAIADEATANMAFSGQLPLADFRAIVRRLEKVLNVHALWVRSRTDAGAETVVLQMERMTGKSASAVTGERKETAASAVSCVT